MSISNNNKNYNIRKNKFDNLKILTNKKFDKSNKTYKNHLPAIKSDMSYKIKDNIKNQQIYN